MNTTWTLPIIIVAIMLGIVLRLLLLSQMNSPDGERWTKRRMQGPFVPLDPEEDKK